jgi:GT2 family glycosyltransferase
MCQSDPMMTDAAKKLQLASVYAVVVSWNGANWIRGALDGLRESGYPVSVVMVDNASTDETVDIVSRAYPEVKLLRMKGNLGFGGANNKGISYALSEGADYVLLLNQDAKVESSMIGQLVNHLQMNPDFGIVSPLHLDYDGQGIDPGFLEYIKSNVCLMSDVYFARLTELYEIPFVPAAIWLLTRQLLEQVGGFDPLFFMYGEDVDLCNRARFHGFKIGLAPRALGYHWHRGSDDGQITVGKRSMSYYAQLVYSLKNPEYAFFPNSINKLLRWTWLSIGHLVFFNLREFLAVGLALLKTGANFFRIRQHYKQSKLKGSLWL